MAAQRQFYLDVDFADHPKVVEAGGDAGWLWVCGMAWASKHLTGLIPKSRIPQLSDRKNPLRLAERLCEVGLWHDRGDHFEIHDFETRNKKMLAARRKAKKAADARWKNADLDAPSMPQAMQQAMPEQCSSNASRVSEPKNQRTKEPKRAVVGGKHSRRLQVVRDDDDIASQAARILAEKALECRTVEKGPVGNPEPWLDKATEQRLERHEDAIRRALAASTWQPEQLARHLEPEAFQEEPPKMHLDFHPLTCECAGQGNDRTCAARRTSA